jgi:hypothetical protein
VSVPLGDSRVVLDAPAGYADTTFLGSPRLQELAESHTSASNRILMFAITDDDLRRFSGGVTPEFRRYLLVVTQKAAERERVTPAAFQRMIGDSMRDFRAPPAGVDVVKHLEKQAVGVPSALAELRKDAAVLSVLQGTRLQPTVIPGFFSNSEKQNYLLSSSTLMLVRGKVINLAVFAVYDSPADAEWVRALTLRWAEDLQRLNNR